MTLIEELRGLLAKASGGTWSADLSGLYVTSDECPLCTPKNKNDHNMVADSPFEFDAQEDEARKNPVQIKRPSY